MLDTNPSPSLFQTICIALYVTGFAEAIVLKFDPNPTNHWLLRGIGIVTVLLLTVVALFGVKYLVRWVYFLSVGMRP